MPKVNRLKIHKEKINGILENNKNIFSPGMRLVVYYKKDKIVKNISRLEHNLLLKPEKRSCEPPMIELYEKWEEDNLKEYTYKFSIPYFRCRFECDFSGANIKDSNFKFRYEKHADRHEPEHHLHVQDGIPPRYKIHNRIELEDFLKIIKREFINEDNKVSFKY